MADAVSVIDVAQRAGVSLGTVSNVLNRPDRVTPAIRARVVQAIDELGFVRNEAARQLRAGRSRTIGLVVLDIRNPFFTDVAAGAEAAAEESGLSVVVCNSGDDVERERHHLSMLQEQRSYGILITSVTGRTGRLDEIRRSGIPSVMVDRASAGSRCSVSVDDVVGGTLAVAHLLALGHTRVAFVGGPLNLNQVRDRLRGAREAVVAAGLPPEALQVVRTAALNVDEGRRAAVRIAPADAGGRPTAVFCANDLLALGVLQEMTRRRVAVPRDMAIVGYDDIDFAAAAAVPLTSVSQPRAQLGDTGTRLLVEEVRAPDSHEHRQVVFRPDLVVRESTVAG